jgi:ATP-binding cassette subfamily B protein/ATP-binding cassette subfamily C protein
MNLSMAHYRNLLGTYLRPQLPKVALLAALLLSSIALQLLNPQIIRYFIDTSQAGGSQQALLGAAALFLGIALARRIAGVATTYVGEYVGWQATNALRADLTLHCLRLDMQFHQRRTPGELIERIDGDVTTLENFFSQFVVRILGNLVLLLGILALLFREDWRVGVGLSIYAALTLAALLSLQRLAVTRWAGLSQAEAEQSGFLEERLAGAEDLRANGATPYVLRGLYRLMRNRFHRARAAFVMNSANSGITRLLYAIGYTAGLAIGVYLFRQGQITIGTVYLITYYLGTLAQPLEALKEQLGDFQQATASIGRIEELFGIPINIREDPRSQLPAGALSVAFDDVSFGYADERRKTKDESSSPAMETDEPRTEVRGLRTESAESSVLSTQSSVLTNISFQLEPGKVLGVLGRTGSGKTTLTRLLFRLYDPDAGGIRLGDVDIRAAGLDDLRGHVGMVTQEVQLFNASVRDNLTLFNRRIADDAILHALREIGLWEWFQTLPEGLDTPLGPAGGGLSAGQAQLLALTRVFLRNPGLVILDEASSRLAPATERLLERAIDRLLANRTGILNAHRLGTVQRADNILILERGRVVEYGPRAALATNPDSRFAQLLRTGLEEVLA